MADKESLRTTRKRICILYSISCIKHAGDTALAGVEVSRGVVSR